VLLHRGPVIVPARPWRKTSQGREESRLPAACAQPQFRRNPPEWSDAPNLEAEAQRAGAGKA